MDENGTQVTKCTGKSHVCNRGVVRLLCSNANQNQGKKGFNAKATHTNRFTFHISMNIKQARQCRKHMDTQDLQL